jgi:hypothetical protein
MKANLLLKLAHSILPAVATGIAFTAVYYLALGRVPWLFAISVTVAALLIKLAVDLIRALIATAASS